MQALVFMLISSTCYHKKIITQTQLPYAKMTSITPQTTLIATLGGQPQIITFALDYLLEQHTPIHGVIVVYLSPRNERLQKRLID